MAGILGPAAVYRATGAELNREVSIKALPGGALFQQRAIIIGWRS